MTRARGGLPCPRSVKHFLDLLLQPISAVGCCQAEHDMIRLHRVCGGLSPAATRLVLSEPKQFRTQRVRFARARLRRSFPTSHLYLHLQIYGERELWDGRRSDTYMVAAVSRGDAVPLLRAAVSWAELGRRDAVIPLWNWEPGIWDLELGTGLRRAST